MWLPRAENFHLPKPQSASFSSASHKSSRRNKLIILALGTKVFYMTLNSWLLQNMAVCHCICNRCVGPFNRLDQKFESRAWDFNFVICTDLQWAHIQRQLGPVVSGVTWTFCNWNRFGEREVGVLSLKKKFHSLEFRATSQLEFGKVSQGSCLKLQVQVV